MKFPSSVYCFSYLQQCYLELSDNIKHISLMNIWCMFSHAITHPYYLSKKIVTTFCVIDIHYLVMISSRDSTKKHSFHILQFCVHYFLMWGTVCKTALMSFGWLSASQGNCMSPHITVIITYILFCELFYSYSQRRYINAGLSEVIVYRRLIKHKSYNWTPKFKCTTKFYNITLSCSIL